MKVFTTDKIRNVAVLGHSGSGKTSLIGAMSSISGGAAARVQQAARRR